MKINHFQRKPVSARYFSIENSFDAARQEMISAGYDVKVSICKYISQGLLPRIYNTFEAAFRQTDINHITGDVHYINLFLNKSKSILTIHDCVFLKHPSPLARSVLKYFWLTLPAMRSAYITCISEATKNEILSNIKYPEDRIKVIPTVVKEDLFKFSTKEFNILEPVILHIGTTPNKNIERVAAALKGIPCTLQIIGPLDEKQKQCLTFNGIHYINEKGITNERIAVKYKEADIVLFASTYEGFGMPILEGQLTGRPVITSNISPMNEVAGDSALFVDPFDITSIRKGVLDLISNPGLRADLIEKGKANTARFSAKKIAGMYIDLYKTISEKS
ncbi:MAG: glycosyltransferase family 4 protein [Opitutaceae bacterium]|nr:glycosyltransferase family 4 protein [Cytophagales bacterium]